VACLIVVCDLRVSVQKDPRTTEAIFRTYPEACLIIFLEPDARLTSFAGIWSTLGRDTNAIYQISSYPAAYLIDRFTTKTGGGLFECLRTGGAFLPDFRVPSRNHPRTTEAIFRV
jgi:hypothetical protein